MEDNEEKLADTDALKTRIAPYETKLSDYQRRKLIYDLLKQGHSMKEKKILLVGFSNAYRVSDHFIRYLTIYNNNYRIFALDPTNENQTVKFGNKHIITFVKGKIGDDFKFLPKKMFDEIIFDFSVLKFIKFEELSKFLINFLSAEGVVYLPDLTKTKRDPNISYFDFTFYDEITEVLNRVGIKCQNISFESYPLLHSARRKNETKQDVKCYK